MTITTFDWCKLDITKASEVRSDVDKILGLLPSADIGNFNSLSHQIQERIHDIELFCTKCNDGKKINHFFSFHDLMIFTYNL